MNISELFENINVRISNGKPNLYKPVLILYALKKCYLKEDRLTSFKIIDVELNDIFKQCLLDENYHNFHYAFGRLENDGIWEITNSFNLKRTDSGDLSKSELIQKNIKGGFTKEIYQALSTDSELLFTVSNQLLNRYFSPSQQQALCSILELPDALTIPINAVQDATAFCKNQDHILGNAQGYTMQIQSNDYIAYLNSLHNINANGANALAESQALSQHFAELYQPFPLINTLYQALTDLQPRVILLTGHAGDGKSTIALDIFKRLHQIPSNQPLTNALDERENINLANGHSVSIVKDMSELTARQRLDWLNQAYHQSGSWLIVSNTGPLLNSLSEFSKRTNDTDLESDILEVLDQPYQNGDLSAHQLTGLPKQTIILNMTRLDNVELGAKVLSRMINHSGWQQCHDCQIQAHCAIQQNRQTLQNSPQVEERVRWIYLRLTAYEQRLTLRQMIAHLAFSLTGGIGCQDAQKLGEQGLEKILFSESFFGFKAGEPWVDTDSLRAVVLLKRLIFGGPVAVNFERQLSSLKEPANMVLPDAVQDVWQTWGRYAAQTSGVRWRFALRRLFYLLGQESTDDSKLFLSSFLQSPRLQQVDVWQQKGSLDLNTSQRRTLRDHCLQVLLELYSGFSAGQFKDKQYLYLTLRRADRNVIQPTQLVIAKLDYDDFSLNYDVNLRCLLLVYRKQAQLALTLPLLDYIYERVNGNLGNDLAPIHLAQLEWFRAELLSKYAQKQPSEEVTLLRAGITGEVELYRYLLDEEKRQLEKY